MSYLIQLEVCEEHSAVLLHLDDRLLLEDSGLPHFP